MPYNTRRKSLSLESLGIHVPNSSRSAHRSPPGMTKDNQQIQPPQKKIKRSHTNSSADSTSPLNAPRKPSIKFETRPKSAGRIAANTPPPSPGREIDVDIKTIDLEGIDDDIVVGVIEQLQKTGNRPHLLKELAAVLMQTLHAVQTSANPAAIISSRLAGYLKRSWSAISPCPLDKVLVGTHPKRVYYFLTTSEPQPITENPETATMAANRIISPALSSNADEEDRDARSRARMSPSPEVDLSNPDFFDDTGSPFTEIAPHPPTHHNIMHNRRAASPPLEKDEREFSQIVETLQARSRSQSQTAEDISKATLPTIPDAMDTAPTVAVEETDDIAARKNSEAAAALFGQSPDLLSAPAAVLAPSSPMVKPHPTPLLGQKRPLEVDVRMSDDDDSWAWSELKSPENIELDELEHMFDDY